MARALSVMQSGFYMLPAIDLNYQFAFKADKVGYEAIPRMLKPELCAELLAIESMPQHLLGVGQTAA